MKLKFKTGNFMTKLGSFNKKKKRKHNIKDMYGTGWYATAPAGERSNWKELATAVPDPHQ